MEDKNLIVSDTQLKQKRKNQKDGVAHFIIMACMVVIGIAYLVAFVIWIFNLITPWGFLTENQLNVIAGLFIGSTLGGILTDKISEIFREHK